MAATVTVTGVAGPAQTVTAQTFTGVTRVIFNTETNILQLYKDGSPSPIDVAITSASTITATKSGSTYTFAIS